MDMRALMHILLEHISHVTRALFALVLQDVKLCHLMQQTQSEGIV